MAQPRYIKCKILPGLFKTEFYVSVCGTSVYVDRAAVKVTREPNGDTEGEGQVLAYIIDEGGEKDQALVELAGEPVIGGLRTWVHKALVTA